MNGAYLTESNVGIAIPHPTSSSIHHGNSYITNMHHGNNFATPTINTHLQISKFATNFEHPKLPLSNQLENQPSLHNNRQTTYSTHNNINVPLKPCISTPDGSNYFQFTASSHPLGMQSYT